MSTSKKKSKRVFVFIDGENMRNAVQDLGFIDLDYNRLYDWFINKRGISRIYLYSAIEQGDTEKEQYLTQLNKLQNFFVISKKVIPYKKTVLLNTVCPACKHFFIRQTYGHRKKGNCDAELTLDIIRFGVRKKYDGIIVFTGDGDFASVFKYVSEDLKKDVFLFVPDGKRTSLKIKELKKSGIIDCENISSILEHYGRKT